jgi:hypothetical protein
LILEFERGNGKAHGGRGLRGFVLGKWVLQEKRQRVSWRRQALENAGMLIRKG